MMSSVTVSTSSGRNGSWLRSMICVLAIFGISFVRIADDHHRFSRRAILLLRANQDVSKPVHLTEMAGQYECGAVHFSDYRRSLEHIVREQLCAIVEFCAERAPVRPDRSLALERGIGGGSAI